MSDHFHPAPSPLSVGGIVGAVELLPCRVDGAGTSFDGLGKRVSLLFGPDLIAALMKRRAQDASEATHV